VPDLEKGSRPGNSEVPEKKKKPVQEKKGRDSLSLNETPPPFYSLPGGRAKKGTVVRQNEKKRPLCRKREEGFLRSMQMNYCEVGLCRTSGGSHFECRNLEEGSRRQAKAERGEFQNGGSQTGEEEAYQHLASGKGKKVAATCTRSLKRLAQFCPVTSWKRGAGRERKRTHGEDLRANTTRGFRRGESHYT